MQKLVNVSTTPLIASYYSTAIFLDHYLLTVACLLKERTIYKGEERSTYRLKDFQSFLCLETSHTTEGKASSLLHQHLYFQNL